MEKEKNILGNRLKENRKQLKLTAEEMSQKVNCSKSMVLMIECGKRKINKKNIDLFAKEYHIDKNFIIEHNNDIPSYKEEYINQKINICKRIYQKLKNTKKDIEKLNIEIANQMENLSKEISALQEDFNIKGE